MSMPAAVAAAVTPVAAAITTIAARASAPASAASSAPAEGLRVTGACQHQADGRGSKHQKSCFFNHDTFSLHQDNKQPPSDTTYALTTSPPLGWSIWPVMYWESEDAKNT